MSTNLEENANFCVAENIFVDVDVDVDVDVKVLSDILKTSGHTNVDEDDEKHYWEEADNSVAIKVWENNKAMR